MEITRRLQYHFRGNWVKRNVLLGTVLSISSIFIVPIIYYLGYLAEVVIQTTDGGQSPPKVTTDTVVSYITKGIPVAGISIVYLIPLGIYVLVFLISAAYGMGAAMHTASSERLVVGGIVGSSVLLVAHMALLFICLPISVSLYFNSDSNKITRAFSPTNIYAIASSKQYFVYIVFTFFSTIICILVVYSVFSFTSLFLIVVAPDVVITEGTSLTFLFYFFLSPVVIFSTHMASVAVLKSGI